MKQDCSKQSGFTLIEVLASIVILTIMFSALSGFFVNSASYSNTFDKKLTAVQLSKSLLESYQAKGFKEALMNIGKPKIELTGDQIAQELGLSEQLTEINNFNATISFNYPDKSRIQTDKLIKTTVTVYSIPKNSSTISELEGYVKK